MGLRRDQHILKAPIHIHSRNAFGVVMLLIMFLLATESIYSRCVIKELFSITIQY